MNSIIKINNTNNEITLQKEKPEIKPMPHINPIEPKEPEIIPVPEKTEPSPTLPETNPIHIPEVTPSPENSVEKSGNITRF